ncbi:MAG: recombination protein O N-terminal domain-containing protein [Nitrospira sp.]
MSYHIYTTEGIILKRTPFGEANILLHVLTADLGLIIASARSARLSVSKLRPALQEYSHVSISCIKGKNGWKVTNVVDKGSFYFGLPEHTHRTLSQVASVLLKMITGESPHREVFETVKTGFDFLKNVDPENISNFETLLVLRILYELGYVVKDSETEIFLEEVNEWGDILLERIKENKIKVVAVINKALKESQL